MTDDHPSRRRIIETVGLIALASGAPLALSSDVSAEDTEGRATTSSVSGRALSARQKRALKIRAAAALDGVSGTRDPLPLPSGPDDKLRAAQFSKALLRTDDTSDKDPSLPRKSAFKKYRAALDQAYTGALSDSGGNPAADFAAIEGLFVEIGKPPAGAPQDQTFKFTNPLGGLGYDVEGLDPPYTSLGTPRAFDSIEQFKTAETAAQMAEVYWLARLRDTDFNALDPKLQPAQIEPIVKRAWDDLNAFSWYKSGGVGAIPWNRLFRVDLRGENNRNPKNPFGFDGVEVGPYLSQFLLIGTFDKATGNDETSGIVNFGSLRLDQRQRTVQKKDYLFTPRPIDVDKEFLAVQNGSRTAIGTDAFAAAPGFISTLRDGANYVHFDEIYQEYLIAASILLSRIPRVGNTVHDNEIVLQRQPADRSSVPDDFAGVTVAETTSVPDEMLNPGNPYRGAKAQVGFATFGVTHILTLLAEVSTRAHKAAWYHKWSLRWLRPEEFAARVHYKITGGADYSIHEDLISSQNTASGRSILAEIRALNGGAPSYLLPMAYPEGCPTHPARPSGHSTVAGASTTILKGLFNGFFSLTQSTPPAMRAQFVSGGRLTPYADSPPLTIGGELNKLASNVSMFRMMGGVHWRGDSVSGLLLGEQIGVHLLIEQTQALRGRDGRVTTPFYREANRGSPFFRIKLFRGDVIDIKDGRVFKVSEDDPTQIERWNVSNQAMTFAEFVAEMY